MTEHLPPPDRRRFPDLEPFDVRVLGADHDLTRIYPAGGRHPMTWSAFGSFGPTGSRFDHHPEPPGLHPDHGVMDAALRLTTAHGPPTPR